MAKAPKKPDPLPQIPRRGGEDPAFPTVGPTEVKTVYSSQIDTKPQGAIDPGLRARITDLRPIPTYKSLGSTSGRNSAAGFGSSLNDTIRNALDRKIEAYNTQLTSQAEKGRAEDILAQRQSAHDRLRLDSIFEIFGVDKLTAFNEQVDDLWAHWKREQKNAQNKVLSSVMGFIGGLL